MKNDHRYSRKSYPEYNHDWDAYADRDRYERDYYQNRSYRPQGYSYNFDDMYGGADYNRHGTRYAGNDFYNEYDRYGDRMRTTYRPEDADRRRYGGGFDRPRTGYRDSGYNRDYDYDQTRYGYSENPNYGYYDLNRNDRNWFHDSDRNWWDRITDEVARGFGDDDAERRRERDRRKDHRGKGPRGYRRPDERIKSDLEDELYNDSYIDASDMEVTVQNGIVTLTGSVESKWIKRRSEDIAETVTGVNEVRNNLFVRKESQQNSADLYSDSDSGSKAASASGNMTSNTSHKAGNTSKIKS